VRDPLRVQGLTWQGHDFLAAARDESRWQAALRMVASG
jgi:hypothetical protein